jgi:hypothetical protein
MYVAVKGGEAAISNAHRLLADRRRGDRSLPAIGIEQIVASWRSQSIASWPKPRSTTARWQRLPYASRVAT